MQHCSHQVPPVKNFCQIFNNCRLKLLLKLFKSHNFVYFSNNEKSELRVLIEHYFCPKNVNQTKEKYYGESASPFSMVKSGLLTFVVVAQERSIEASTRKNIEKIHDRFDRRVKVH